MEPMDRGAGLRGVGTGLVTGTSKRYPTRVTVSIYAGELALSRSACRSRVIAVLMLAQNPRTASGQSVC